MIWRRWQRQRQRRRYQTCSVQLNYGGLIYNTWMHVCVYRVRIRCLYTSILMYRRSACGTRIVLRKHIQFVSIYSVLRLPVERAKFESMTIRKRSLATILSHLGAIAMNSFRNRRHLSLSNFIHKHRHFLSIELAVKNALNVHWVFGR